MSSCSPAEFLCPGRQLKILAADVYCREYSFEEMRRMQKNNFEEMQMASLKFYEAAVILINPC